MERKSIMVDMDDVITTGGFIHLINKFLGTKYTEKDFSDNFYMQDIIPNKEDFFNWFVNQNMYNHCKMIPMAYEVLKELNEEYKLYIGTSYIFKEIPNKSGYILNQKFEYLQNNLSFISPYQYIFLSDKSVLNIDIKIDDRLDNLTNTNRKLLFSAYHNRNISNEYLEKNGIERVEGWNDIKRKLLIK